MEVKIGILMAPRELVVETSASVTQVQQDLADARENSGILTINDSRGNIVLIPADNIAYVELSSTGPRQIGFGS
jgi:hypothetical protein